MSSHVCEKQVKAELQSLLDRCQGFIKESSKFISSSSSSDAVRINTFYEQQMAAVSNCYDAVISKLKDSKAAHIDTLKRCCREQIAAAATNKAKNTQILDTASGLLNELSQVHHSGKPYEELSKLMKRAQLDLKQLRPLDKLQSTFYTFTESLNVIDNCKLTLKKSEDDMWVCRFCSLLNPQTSAVCDVCLGRRQRCKLCNCEHDESEPCMTNDFSASSDCSPYQGCHMPIMSTCMSSPVVH
eukprot:CAMPEP_0204903446 /NCGR_PEP_ID=MMETSP1397-20131031/4260_1 /ASSEMBLY_ACC=CAM_ASM_000891 /TAXON_ID=49980 /ORGANISM="Climacostomum Climacostomum virens, Strain Stock W-24" /LENGTH=241 /DNA_ID=CAMNT_0052072083 /DNA_START=314 /DNA_END=1036 /DNA_ORIENTATION=+